MIGRIALGFVMLLASCIVTAAVSVSVDRASMSVTESFNLVIQATEGENLDNINFSPLIKDFDAISKSTRSSTSYTNGRREGSQELILTLLPKRSGKLLLPSLNVDGKPTSPIGLMVKEGSDELSASDVFFVEMEADRDNVYVMGQLRLTIRTYRAVSLTNIDNTALNIENAEIEPLGKNNYSQAIDGVSYQVSEWSFAVYPLQSGTLEIPGIQFQAQQVTGQRGFFSLGNRRQTIRRNAKPITIDVKPMPREFSGDTWLPSEKVEIKESWSTPLENMNIGDSVTRTITLQGIGLRGSQLPDLPQPELAGIKIYPDQPSRENVTSAQGLTALGIQSAAWVVTEAGEYHIPEISVPWWDTKDNKLRYATLAARSFSVASTLVPGPVENEGPPSTVSVRQNPLTNDYSVWVWITAAMALGWLLTVLFFLHRRGDSNTPQQAAKSTAVQTENSAFKNLVQQCNNNCAQTTRLQLSAWLCAVFPDLSNPTLSELKRRANSRTCTLLDELERALYGPTRQTWEGAPLADALKDVRKQMADKQKNSRADTLPVLYPS